MRGSRLTACSPDTHSSLSYANWLWLAYRIFTAPLAACAAALHFQQLYHSTTSFANASCNVSVASYLKVGAWKMPGM